jgi:hypothetical protein
LTWFFNLKFSIGLFSLILKRIILNFFCVKIWIKTS